MTLSQIEQIQKDLRASYEAGNFALEDIVGALEALIPVAKAAQSLMSEDDAREALAHYNCLHILADKLAALEAPP